MNDTVYWIWLSLSCTIDTGTFSKLIKQFDDAKAIYDASEHEIAECIGYKTSDRSSLANKSLERAEEIYEFCTKFKVGILKYSDIEYPEALRKISTPPVLLYYRGKLPDFNSGLYVGVVGTRELSEYGRKNAFNISYDLATAGVTVVSGMALGIDGVALAGALAAEKPTVAVLGSGIDVCYPAQHLTLAREIVRGGCVLTEYPPKTKPNKYNFPKRNRIISGLCSATLVIEGRERSGALITARYAEEQGRTVFALPGNVGADHSELTNLLLKKNAKPATRAEDILDFFEKDYKSSINKFLLSDRRKVDMMYVLRTLEVVANCPSDDIYNQPWIIKRTVSNNANRSEEDEQSAFNQPSTSQEQRIKDKEALLESIATISAQREKARESKAGSNATQEKAGKGALQAKNGANVTQATIANTLQTKTDTGTAQAKVDANAAQGAAGKESASRDYLPERYASQSGATFSTLRRQSRDHQGSATAFRNYTPTLFSGGNLSTVSEIPAHFVSGKAGIEDPSPFDFDELTLKIYKKIPPGGAIEIEELTTENLPMRTVMKHLTHLETGKFIVILPGGKVMRKY